MASSEEQEKVAQLRVLSYRAFNILSFDGDAEPGLVDYLQDAYPRFLQKLDLVTGVSVGAALALKLAAGTSRFGSMTLRDLDKKVAIVARTPALKIFHNFSGYDSDGDELVRDVALKSEKMPTYLYNPSLVGVVQALDPRSGKVDLAQIRVLSLGGGSAGKYVKEMVNFQCKVLLKERFHRVNNNLEATIEWLQKYWT